MFLPWKVKSPKCSLSPHVQNRILHFFPQLIKCLFTDICLKMIIWISVILWCFLSGTGDRSDQAGSSEREISVLPFHEELISWKSWGIFNYFLVWIRSYSEHGELSGQAQPNMVSSLVSIHVLCILLLIHLSVVNIRQCASPMICDFLKANVYLWSNIQFYCFCSCFIATVCIFVGFVATSVDCM